MKAAFVGFGEVNTPIDIIVKKCTDAEALLKKEGLDLVSVYPVTDDREEKDVKRAVETLKKEDFFLRIIKMPVVTSGSSLFAQIF